MNIDDAENLIETARKAQELANALGLHKRRSALDPDPKLLFDLIKQAQRPEIQYFLRQQRVEEEAMERFLQGQQGQTVTVNIRIDVDDQRAA